MTARNPRINPQPDDTIEARGFTFWVDRVDGGEVYALKYKTDHQIDFKRIRVSLEVWRRDLAEVPA